MLDEFDAVFGGDGDGAAHVRAAGLGEFLGLFGEEILEAGRAGVDEHLRRRGGVVLERVDNAAWREDGVAGMRVVPAVCDKKAHAAFEHIEPFILPLVPVWRRPAAGRRDVGEHRERAAGLRGGEMEVERVAERAVDAGFGKLDEGGLQGGFVFHSSVKAYARRWFLKNIMLVGNAYLLGMLEEMELRHLRYFATVAAEQSITRAAAKLHVSQPPLSRQIRDLEDELGVRLLERGPKQVALTAAGKIFFRDTQKILALADAAAQRVRAAAKGHGGEVCIGYSPTISSSYLPRALKIFRAAKPQVRIKLLDLVTDDMISAVETKKLDLALLVRPQGVKWRTLEFKKLFELPIGVVVPPQHRLARRKSVTLDEVLAEPIVAFTRNGYSDYHNWLAAALKLSRLKPRVLPEADGSTSLVAEVEAGHGISFAPPTLAAAHKGRVKFLSISTPVPRIEVGMLVRKGHSNELLVSLQQAIEAAARS